MSYQQKITGLIKIALQENVPVTPLLHLDMRGTHGNGICHYSPPNKVCFFWWDSCLVKEKHQITFRVSKKCCLTFLYYIIRFLLSNRAADIWFIRKKTQSCADNINTLWQRVNNIFFPSSHRLSPKNNKCYERYTFNATLFLNFAWSSNCTLTLQRCNTTLCPDIQEKEVKFIWHLTHDVIKQTWPQSLSCQLLGICCQATCFT